MSHKKERKFFSENESCEGISTLIKKCDHYLGSKIELSEEDIKTKLIEPLFEYLNWDIRDDYISGEVLEQKHQPSGKPGKRLNSFRSTPEKFPKTKS